MKIARRVRLFFITPTIVLSCTAALVSFLIAKNSIEQSTFQHLETTAHSRAAHIETFLELHKSYLLHLPEILPVKRLLAIDKTDPHLGLRD